MKRILAARLKTMNPRPDKHFEEMQAVGGIHGNDLTQRELRPTVTLAPKRSLQAGMF